MRFRNANSALINLSSLIVARDPVPSRAGRVKEIGPLQFTLERPWEREIIAPARKARLETQIAETMWVLAGRNDVKWLQNYLPRAAEFSDDGLQWRAGYGPRLRKWDRRHDQIANVVNELTANPNSRRAIISLWDPAQDYVETKDVPCNNWLHFFIRDGRLHVHIATRSNDLIWGWSGINQFEWSTLQEIIAYLLGVEVGLATYSISSLHVYERHWPMIDQLAQEINVEYPTDQIRFSLPDQRLETTYSEIRKWFAAEEIIRKGGDGPTGMPQSPLFNHWLDVIHLHHTQGAGSHKPDPFLDYVNALHSKKHAAYGDSWCRRGEKLGIMANIARKVDRLGRGDDTETNADTAIDLMVYLAKYVAWLDGDRTAGPRAVDAVLRSVMSAPPVNPIPFLQKGFENLWVMVETDSADKQDAARGLLSLAIGLARREWGAR